jgi:hypothetical protein
MSGQNPYEQLGVTEASSFEDIQNARNRLFAEHQGDRKQLEQIEAAYDAVLMDRLRQRQEGKIKVPDRIRFPEKMVQAAPSPASIQPPTEPGWLQRLIDTPSRSDILLPAGILAALSALVLFVPAATLQQTGQAALILGVGATFYFLFRKERKFGRAVLLSLVGMVLGLAIGYGLAEVLKAPLSMVKIELEAFTLAVNFFVLWLISSFLR